MKKSLQRDIKGSLGAVTGANAYTSLWTPIDSFQSYMIQIVWTGTPTASITLLTSADPIPPLETYSSLAAAAPVIYDVVANSSKSTSGINIVTYDNIQTAANWVALQWTNASGSGTITSVRLVGKGSQT